MTIDSKKVQRYNEFLATRKEQDVEAQIAEAEKIVHLIDQIDSRKAFKQVQKRVREKKDKIQFLDIVTRVAAILFVPLLITSIIFFSKERIQSEIEHFATQTISNPSGVRSEIVLPDSSKVWLNAESVITYTIPFGLKERDVKLTGEAFFEVKKDKLRPFHVESGQLKVTVLGTRFNYKAFPEDKAIEVVLAEGKVKLSTVGSKSDEDIILEPGQRAKVDKETKKASISSEEIERYIGWHEGKLIFDDCPLSEVARQLERWFGIEVEITDPKIKNYRISTTFENESLHQILTMLELASPIEAKLIPAMLDKTTQNKSMERVIIIGKN